MARITNPAALPLADRLTVILMMLRQITADQGFLRRLNPLLKMAIWNRITFFTRRFRDIATNPPKPRPNRRQRIRTIAKQPNPQQPKLPTRRAWLLHLLPGHQVPGARSQLQYLLSEPDMTALITQTPQLGRILRPLCHMLGIPLPAQLRLPPRSPNPNTAKPRSPRNRIKPIKPPEPQPLTLYQHLLQKYPPPPRPMLPGHRYTPLNPRKNHA